MRVRAGYLSIFAKMKCQDVMAVFDGSCHDSGAQASRLMLAMAEFALV
jgi:hypothetical protein